MAGSSEHSKGGRKGRNPKGGGNKANPRYANGTRRREVQARLRARHDPCAICGQPIDYDLPPEHPMSFTVDEIVPVSHGGSPYDMDNVQAAHRICNIKRGDRPMGEVRDPHSPFKPVNDATLPQSREW